MSDANVKDLQAKALRIKQLYEQLNAAAGRKKWGATDFMSGFVGDVGDLSKLIMAKQNLRHIDDMDEKLAHELADCLWSVLVLAHELNVDLPAAFDASMNDLANDLEQKVAA